VAENIATEDLANIYLVWS